MTTSSAKDNEIIPGKTQLEKLRKAKLIDMLLKQWEDARLQLEDKDRRIAELSDELARLKGEIDKEQSKQKIKNINKHVNQPTSKKPEWDKDGNPKPKAKEQKKKRKKRHQNDDKRIESREKFSDQKRSIMALCCFLVWPCLLYMARI